MFLFSNFRMEVCCQPLVKLDQVLFFSIQKMKCYQGVLVAINSYTVPRIVIGFLQERVT